MIVEEKVMPAPPEEAPLLVLSKVIELARAAIPVMAMAPPCVTMFPPRLIAAALELELVAGKLARAVLAPMFPESVIVPLEPAVKVRP